MVDIELLINLIKKAQGNRSLNQFAKDCNIDSGNLSRILNNKNKQPPKPETLKKIASASYDNTTYEELMTAAGHITLSEAGNIVNDYVLTPKDEKDIEKKIKSLREDLLSNNDGLMLCGDPVSEEAIESLIETLSYGIKQAKIINKKYTPNKYKE